MKNALALFINIFIMSLCLNAQAQFQRLSILPQANIIITGSQPAKVKVLSIDYYRDAPKSTDTVSGVKYNQVYSTGEIIIKINGKVTARTFQSLVEPDDSLILIEPAFAGEACIKLNKSNPETKTIKNIELEVKTHTEIGNIPDDRCVQQTSIIFHNWGQNISQEEYWNRAKCLDILQKSGQLSTDNNGILSHASMNIMNLVYNRYDSIPRNNKTFKVLIDRGFILVDEKGELTKESRERLKQFYYYKYALSDAKRLDTLWREYSAIGTNHRADSLTVSNNAEAAYYNNDSVLTTLDSRNKELRDTLIRDAICFNGSLEAG